MSAITLYPRDKLKEVKCDQCKNDYASYTYKSISQDDFYDFCSEACFGKWCKKKANQQILEDDREEKIADEEAAHEDDLDDESWKEALHLAKVSDFVNYSQVILYLLEHNAPGHAYKELRERMEVVNSLQSLEKQLEESPAPKVDVQIAAEPLSPASVQSEESAHSSAVEEEEAEEQSDEQGQ